MMVQRYLRTKDLADAARISVQQVRNYETDGFLPPVERSPSGYRRYTAQHLTALLTARQLIGAYGRQRTQQLLGATYRGALGEALALINERHAELDRARLQLDQTQATLDTLAQQLPTAGYTRLGRRLRVGAAARLVGVRVSALRFWEQQDLLRPSREEGSRYRVYDERQVRRLRIVVLLRQAHHDFAAIRATLDELEAGQPQRAVAAVQQRRDELAAAGWHCLRAVAAYHDYVTAYLTDLPA